MSRFLLASVRWVSAVEPFFCRLRRGGEVDFLKMKIMKLEYVPFPGMKAHFIWFYFVRLSFLNFKEHNSRWGRFYEEENDENKVRAVSQNSRLRFYHFLPSSKALMTFSGTRSKYRRQSSTNPSPRSGNRSRTWETSESSSTPEMSGTLFGFLEGSDWTGPAWK